MSFTAANAITAALRLIGILDLYEQPNAQQIALGVEHLREVLLTTFMDAMQGFQLFEYDLALPALQSDFYIGTAKSTYDVQVNARMLQSIFLGYVGATKYEMRREPWNKLLRVATTSSLPVRYATADQIDGSIRVKVWPTPTQVISMHLLGYNRIEVPTAADGSEIVQVPPDAEMAIKYALAVRSRPVYGVPVNEVTEVIQTAKPLIDLWKTGGRLNPSVQLLRSK